MMRARRTYINIHNEECTIDIPPVEDRIEHHQSPCAQAAIAVCGYALSVFSSHHPAVDFAAGATTVGFFCSWMAVVVWRKKPCLADFMAKINFTAAVAVVAVVVPMGFIFVPGNFKSLSLLLPVIPTIATLSFG
ncbi:hypothetical protein CDL12_15678 [Handroanthus impetiginosus]|uniref:Uncharacterized protein n=1 Tax=Handroanthus impetiginosus TaxID=429701 RepID=A0A2G9H2H2_9LAMI|nr:hypothetical protein CDL12_15678 [Handroanthus impetiginosus]